MKMLKSTFPLEIKADTDTPGRVVGYGSIFGNEDAYGDIVAKGAFAESISTHEAQGTMPAMLWQHNTDWPIGKWTSLSEDERGLKLEGQFNLNTSRGVDSYEHAKAGDISGLSIGFFTNAYEWDDEKSQRTLTAIDLWEVSLVTFPANDQARLTDTKLVEEIDAMGVTEIERMLREATLSRGEAKALCHRLQFLGEQRKVAETEELKTKLALARLQGALAA